MSDTERVSLNQQVPPEPSPADQGYVPPTDLVPLPSSGKVYPQDSQLYLKDGLEIRSMTAKEEDILTSRALLKQGKAISTLLKSCLVNRAIDVEEMLVGDRNAMLVAIRITGYGPEYTVKVDCPACEQRVEHTFDLSALEVKRLQENPLAEGTNAFKFRLPVSQRDVVFKLLTGADERELSVNAEQMRKKMPDSPEQGVTLRLLAQLVSVGGETDRNKLGHIVRSMHAKDSRSLRIHIDKISPGILMEQEFECPACKETSTVDLPMGTEFFWPTAG